jgi:transcriptional regulator with XRE-family HTH domain
MTLGERVFQMRRAQGITQERLAEKSDVGRITIVKLESGAQRTATWETVARLAKAFGLTLDEFVAPIDTDIEGALACAVEGQ